MKRMYLMMLLSCVLGGDMPTHPIPNPNVVIAEKTMYWGDVYTVSWEPATKGTVQIELLDHTNSKTLYQTEANREHRSIRVQMPCEKSEIPCRFLVWDKTIGRPDQKQLDNPNQTPGCSHIIQFKEKNTKIEIEKLPGTIVKEVPLNIKWTSKNYDSNETVHIHLCTWNSQGGTISNERIASAKANANNYNWVPLSSMFTNKDYFIYIGAAEQDTSNSSFKPNMTYCHGSTSNTFQFISNNNPVNTKTETSTSTSRGIVSSSGLILLAPVLLIVAWL